MSLQQQAPQKQKCDYIAQAKNGHQNNNHFKINNSNTSLCFTNVNKNTNSEHHSANNVFYNCTSAPTATSVSICSSYASEELRNQVDKTQTYLDWVTKLCRGFSAFYEPTCTWSGQLPIKTHRFYHYSSKVFLGGIPWDMSEQTIMQIFRPYGSIRYNIDNDKKIINIRHTTCRI